MIKFLQYFVICIFYSLYIQLRIGDIFWPQKYKSKRLFYFYNKKK